MIKYLFKRYQLAKWLVILNYRVVIQRRSVFALSDVPTAVLRWYAIYGVDQFLEYAADDEYTRSMYLSAFDAVCAELEIREARRRYITAT